MAKRFTDTEIWNKHWFRKLKPARKEFVRYLFENCDHAGIWDVDIELAEFFIGEEIGDPLTWLPEDFVIIEIKDGEKWFLPKFLKFQYTNGLNSDKPALKSVFKILEQYELLEKVNEIFGDDFLKVNYQSTNDKASINNRSTIEDTSIKDKDKDKDKRKDKDMKRGEGEKQNPITLPWQDDDFKQAWEDWKEYKFKEHKFKFKSNKTEQTALNGLHDKANGDKEAAKRIIKKSIENGWKGLFPEDNNQNTNQQKNQPMTQQEQLEKAKETEQLLRTTIEHKHKNGNTNDLF